MKKMKTTLCTLLVLSAMSLTLVGCTGMDNPPEDGTTTATTTTTPALTTTGETLDSTVSGSLSFTANGNGTCTLTGLGNCTDTCVIVPATDGNGNRVTAIAAGAFKSDRVSAVELPASIESIADGAFAGCSKLTYISVSLENTAYRSQGGILYNNDETVLVACPAARPEATLTIAASVKTIAPSAFAGCTALKTINYSGSAEQWKKVSVGSDNAILVAASVKYDKEDGKS